MSTTPAPNLPARILHSLAEVLGSLLDGTQALVAENAMDVLMGLLTLVLGWMVASVFRGLASKLARAVGVDVIADRTKLRAYMVRHDVQQPLSRYLGWVLYAVILYVTTVVAFETMGLAAAADFLRRLASYLPRAGVVLILLALGVGLGKLAYRLTYRAARMSGLPVPELLGGFSRAAVVLFALFLALNYLEWASQSVLIAGFALVIGVALGVAILFTIAARGLTESLLSHPFIKATYSKGDVIACPACEGTVVKIDAAATHVRQDDALLIVPNRVLAAQTVSVTRKSKSP